MTNRADVSRRDGLRRNRVLNQRRLDCSAFARHDERSLNELRPLKTWKTIEVAADIITRRYTATAHVRLWHKADMPWLPGVVGFCGKPTLRIL